MSDISDQTGGAFTVAWYFTPVLILMSCFLYLIVLHHKTGAFLRIADPIRGAPGMFLSGTDYCVILYSNLHTPDTR